MPAFDPALTTARMTAFRPGASPPPVRTPIFLIAVDMDDETVAPSRGRVQLKRSRGVGAGRQRASKPNGDLRNCEIKNTRLQLKLSGYASPKSRHCSVLARLKYA